MSDPNPSKQALSTQSLSNQASMRGFGSNGRFVSHTKAGISLPAIASAPVASAPPPQLELGPSAVLLGFYAFAFVVPIAELLVVYLHIHIPIVVIAGAILSLILLGTGRIAAFLSYPAAKPWIALAFLSIVAAGLGVYPGRSVPFILEFVVRFQVFPIYACAIVTNTRQVRHALSWIAWGSFLLLAMCIVLGELSDGRLMIRDTDLANPNDLGLEILLVMCALLVFRSRFTRAIALLACPVFLLEVLRTGSRACFVTLIAIVFALFCLAPARVRIIMALLLPIGAGVIAATVSSFTLSRLTLIVSNVSSVETGDEQLDNAIASQAARTELQRRAIGLALRHPLLGVGALNLADAVDEMVRQLTGMKSGWQGAHNTYLEVAAENGIPAMILYVWVLAACVRTNLKSYKTCMNTPELNHAAAQSLALLLMISAFAICTTFSNNAYSPPCCMILGLSVANAMAIERERPRQASQPATARTFGRRLPARGSAALNGGAGSFSQPRNLGFRPHGSF